MSPQTASIALTLSLLCFGDYSNSQDAKQDKLVAVEATKEHFSITKYQPIYFAYGNPSTKLQFSFKYQLVDWIPVFFGYTQTMFWDLSKDSEPFKDVNFGPDIFYTFEIKNVILNSINVAPYSHLSNGRDGPDSRSMNRTFVRFNLKMPFYEGELKVDSKISTFYNLSSDNSDIDQYIGPLDLRLTITQFLPWAFDRGEFYFRVFPGGSNAERWDRGGRELGFSFRVGGIGLKPSLYLLYYNG